MENYWGMALMSWPKSKIDKINSKHILGGLSFSLQTEKMKKIKIFLFWLIPVRGDCLAVTQESAMPLDGSCHVTRMWRNEHITFYRDNVIKCCSLRRMMGKCFQFFLSCYCFLSSIWHSLHNCTNLTSFTELNYLGSLDELRYWSTNLEN